MSSRQVATYQSAGKSAHSKFEACQ